MRELGFGEADAVVPGVEHVVESLEERHAVDEVEARARRGTDVVDDEVDVAWRAANRGVQLRKIEVSSYDSWEVERMRAYNARPNLSVRREFKRILRDEKLAFEKEADGVGCVPRRC